MMTKHATYILPIIVCCWLLTAGVVVKESQTPKMPSPRHQRDVQMDKLELALLPVFYPDKKSILADETQLNILREDAVKMKKYPEAKFLVTAYTDMQGKEEDNMVLTIQASQFICAKLISYGVNGDMLVCTGQGQTDRYCKEKTEDCYKLNRRVTIAMMSE